MANKEITLEDIEKEIEVFESKECNNQNNLFMEGYRYCFDRFSKLIEQWSNKNKQLEQENQQLKNKLKYWVDIYTDLKKWLEEEYKNCDKIGNPSIGYAMGQIKRTQSKIQELEKEN